MEASVWTPGSKTLPLVNANSTLLFQSFTANQGQVIFNVTNFVYVPNVGSLLVFINGVLQAYGVDYYETSSTQFQLVEGCEAGDVVLALGFVGIQADITIIQGEVTSFNARTGVVTLSYTDVVTALGFTPIAAAHSAVITPNLLNGWVNLGMGDQPVGYWKDNFGIVHLEGHAKNGALGLSAFSLNVGYRPVNTLTFPVWGGAGAEKTVTVGFDGTVYIAGLDNTYVSFDGIHFRTN